MKIKLFITLCTMMAAGPLFGWGDMGHSTVGRIAEQSLTPEGKNFVYQILGLDPMAVAATWPDHVRDDVRFAQFAQYHFLDIPENPQQVANPKNSDALIQQAPALLKDPKVSREAKMILMKYLIHIVGDVHQPLHIGNGVDRGANYCLVKFQNPETHQVKEMNLHAVWDDELIYVIGQKYKKTFPKEEEHFFGYQEFADMILGEKPLAVTYEDAIKSTPTEWYDESRALHQVVYPDVTPVHSATERTYCRQQDPVTGKKINGNFNAATIPPIDSAYVDRAIPIVKKRILQAGYRLAGLLNRMAIETGTKPLPANAHKDLIESLLFVDHSK